MHYRCSKFLSVIRAIERGDFSCTILDTNLPDNTETNFAISVQVWIKPDPAIACGLQFNPWWSYRIIGRTSDQEIEEPTFVWSVKWSSN